MAIETFHTNDRSKWRYALIGGQDLDEKYFTIQDNCNFDKMGGELHINRNWFMPFENFLKVLLNYLYYCDKNNSTSEDWINYLRCQQLGKY